MKAESDTRQNAAKAAATFCPGVATGTAEAADPDVRLLVLGQLSTADRTVIKAQSVASRAGIEDRAPQLRKLLVEDAASRRFGQPEGCDLQGLEAFKFGEAGGGGFRGFDRERRFGHDEEPVVGGARQAKRQGIHGRRPRELGATRRAIRLGP